MKKSYYEYYDTLYNEQSVITFKSINLTQTVRLIAYLTFAMILSIKINNKEKIKELIKVLGITTFCAVIWGLIQFIMYYLGLEYPAFLFNNNPYAAQGYDQMMYGIKRICSIATEPSVFALNLVVFLPIIIVYVLKESSKNTKKLSIAVILTMVCTILTTSTTALVGVAIIISVLTIYLIIKDKRERKNRLIKVLLYSAISIVIAGVLCFGGNEIYNNKSLKSEIVATEENTILENNTSNNKENVVSENTNMNIEDSLNIEKENENTEINNIENERKIDSFINALKQMTIEKLESGSGQERINREKLGFEIFLLSPILGVGWISFRTFTLFTNVLVNVGLISIIYIFVVVIKQIIKNRKKDSDISLMFGLSILGMLVAFAVSIPDLHYIYCWVILVLAYNYFKD